jgi:hypothetical protein
MSRRSRLFITVILAALGAASSAQAKPDGAGSLILSLAGVANDQVKDVQDGREDNEINMGGAALIEAGVNDHFGIETGALLVNRQYDAERGDVRVVQEVKRVHIPVLARFWFADFFSVAAGPFVAFKTGHVKNALEIGGDEVATLETSADDDAEYGADGAVTFDIAVADKTGLFIEGRYSTLFNDKNDEDTDEISALAGVKIDL